MYLTKSQNLKFSIVFTGTDDPVCNFHCSNLYYLLLFNGFYIDIRYYSY